MPNPLFFIPLAILAVALPIFIVAEYRASRNTVLPLKLLCSLCFLAVACIGVALRAPMGLRVFDGLMIAGFVLSLLGDVALVWIDRRQYFIIGLGLFLLAQVCYGLAFSFANGFSAWDILLFATFAGLPLAAYFLMDIDVGKMKGPVLAYLVVIAFMLAKAVSTLYLYGLPQPAYWLAPIGAGLFYISDSVLALHKFHRRPWAGLRAVNLVTYYAGQILLALTVWF